MAPNRLAVSASTKPESRAWAKSTKPNSPPWLSNSPKASALRQFMRKTMPIRKRTAVFVMIRAAAIEITKRARGDRAEIEHHANGKRKKRPSRIDRKGSTSASSS